MKNVLAGLGLISLTLVVAASIRPQVQTPATKPETAGAPVVVELFTSEGCSSCPPADALLARLSNARLSDNAQIIALEEHVDYWDNQGWVDPFSSADLTARQWVYAGILGNKNAYTPQMVVDGAVEFVGNHPEKAHDAILKAVNKTKIPVTVAQDSSNGAGKEKISVKVGKLEGASKGDPAEVWLAITETGLHSSVTRGENAGEDLHHAAVVRSMRKIGEAKGDGETSFAGDAGVSLKKEWKRENLKAVLFVQEKKSRRILGAAEIRIAE